MSNYTFKIPFSNPFPMFRIENGKRTYSPYDDKLNAVQSRYYHQYWTATDRLSFQCSWYNIDLSTTFNLNIAFEINGIIKRNISFQVANASSYGTKYHCVIIQNKNLKTNTRNGVFCFTQLFNDITDDDGNPLFTFGDCFRVLISSPFGTWESNYMDYTDDVSGTKLIHYSQTSDVEQNIFDTYFGCMVYGYDLRLHGYYKQVDMASDMDIFSTSDGGLQMIQSLPKWTATLNLGYDGVGLPLYYLNLINIVVCCDEKSIADFGEFEFADGKGFEASGYDDYGNQFYSGVIARKANTASDFVSGENKQVAVVAGEVKQGVDQFVEVMVHSESNGRWHVGSGLPENTTISRITGGIGNTTLRMRFADVEEDTDIRINILDDNDRVVGFETITLKKKQTRGGLNYMKIGDSFRVA